MIEDRLRNDVWCTIPDSGETSDGMLKFLLLSDTSTSIVRLGSRLRACFCSLMMDDRLRKVLCRISASNGTSGGIPAGRVGLLGGSRRHCCDFGFGQSVAS